MPLEIYLATLVASSCIVLLTVSSVVAAVYFRARFASMERQVTRLDGDLTGLIHESLGLVRKVQHVAACATNAVNDVGHMTRTAAGWINRADRMIDGVIANVTEPPMQFVAKYLKFGRGFLNGATQALLAQGRKG